MLLLLLLHPQLPFRLVFLHAPAVRCAAILGQVGWQEVGIERRLRPAVEVAGVATWEQAVRCRELRAVPGVAATHAGEERAAVVAVVVAYASLLLLEELQLRGVRHVLRPNARLQVAHRGGCERARRQRRRLQRAREFVRVLRVGGQVARGVAEAPERRVHRR